MGGRVAQSCWLLLTLSLKGILGGDWSVHLPSSPICAVTGSSVVLPCSYDYPQMKTKEEGGLSSQGGEGEGQQYKVLSEMWCLEDSRCITPSYVFHSAGIFPHPSYQNRVKYLGQQGTKNCSLRIDDLRQSDSGAYVFHLITSHPTQKMPEQSGVQLLVADSSSTVTVSASPSRDITEGISLRMACCSPAAAQARFSWYKSTDTSPRHIGQVWNISEVTSEDSGSYYCQIQTGDKVENSTMLPIDVEYSPRNTAVSVFPAGELQAGLPVTLTCSSDANPPVRTYTWYKGAACLPTADKSCHPARQSLAMPIGKGPTLSSANITTEEYGEHCCVASNRHGSQTYSVTLRCSTDSSSTVTVSASPSRNITEGVSLRMACCSPAAAQARFSWYKSTDTSPRHIGQVWNISKVTSEDSGSYYCQIQTGDKVENSTMLPIDVEYSPRNTAVSVFPAGELQAGLPVTLTCSSDANPPVRTYTWYQGAACLPTANKSCHPARQSLVMPTGRGPTFSSANITTEEYGEHCCVASNRHGSQTYSVTLRRSKVMTPSDTSGRRVLLLGVTICVLLAVIVIVAFLMARRRKSPRHQSYVLTETTATAP